MFTSIEWNSDASRLVPWNFVFFELNEQVLSLLQELNIEQKKRRFARSSPLATIIYEVIEFEKL